MMARVPAPALDHEFASLRLSSLTRAAAIAPLVAAVTLGPRAAEPPQRHVPESPPELGSKSASSAPIASSPPEPPSLARLLHTWDVHRRDEAARLRDSMLRKMGADRAEMITKFRHEQELANEKKIQDRLTRELEINRELATDDRLAKLEQERLDRENKANSERLKKILENQIETKEMLKKYNSVYSQISSCHREILNTCSKDELGIQVLNDHGVDLSNIISSINSITENCKTHSVTAYDLQQAAIILRDIDSLKNTIIECIERAENAAKVASVKSEPPPDVPEVKNDSIENNQRIVIKNDSRETKIDEFYSRRSYDKYLELKEFLSAYECGYKALLEDSSMKKFRFDCQKAVNTPVNAISSLSGEHIRDKYEKLSKLLNGEKVIVGDVYVSAAQHPQGIFYCTDLLARKIVQQGDQLVSGNSEAAFPIASVCVALWARFPDFGKLLCARFQKSCPYIVPMILPQLSEQPIEEFYRSRGYTYNDEGEVEKQDKFLKRISGIFKLYAAIWVTRMPDACRMPHPQNLSDAWRWLAAFVNLKPEADICATLLFDFLTICGNDMYKLYNVQFYKILKYLTSEYFSKLEKIDNGGPKCRLDVFLQNLINSGQIPPPPGIVSSNFW